MKNSLVMFSTPQPCSSGMSRRCRDDDPGVVPLKESADKKKIEGKGGLWWISMENSGGELPMFLGEIWKKMLDELPNLWDICWVNSNFMGILMDALD